MSAVRVPLLYSFAERYALLAVNLASGMVLARILSPSETGVYSVGSVLAGLAQVLRDFGVGQFIVQEATLERAVLRAALGVSYLLAGAMAALIFAASTPLAAFYHDGRVGDVLRLLALNMLLIPVTSLCLPVLRRTLRFGAVCAINMAGGITGAAVAVWLAWRGWSYASLAWGTLAGSLASAAASLALRPAELPWLPSLRGARRVLRFGGITSGGTLVDEAGVAAPDLVIGRVLGVEAAGILGKAQGALAVFRTAILAAVTPVLLPYFAEQERRHGNATQAFLATVNCLCACAWPFFAALALAAPQVVLVLYGAQWVAAVPLIRIMCIATSLYSMGTVSRYLFVATGHAGLQARIDLYGALVRMLAVAVGALGGLELAAWSLVAAAAYRTWIMERYLQRTCGVAPAVLLLQCRPGAALGVLCALAVQAGLLVSGPPVVQLGAAVALGTAAWVAGLCALRHPLRDELPRAWRVIQRRA